MNHAGWYQSVSQSNRKPKFWPRSRHQIFGLRLGIGLQHFVSFDVTGWNNVDTDRVWL